MRQSEFFLRTQNNIPKDEIAVNAQLLLRGNFVHKIMAGVYAYLPLGFRVRDRIMAIIREEMNALGASELLMPALHPRAVWDPTGRWEGLKKIMYQFEDKSGREIGLGPTHEEVVTLLAKPIIRSYHDLPLAVYQIQEKFRNEPRAKSGVLRGREFTMKDLYSFHTDEHSLHEFYDRVKSAYTKIFTRCGLRTVVTEASGGDFSKEYSHEFMVVTDAGEDEIIMCRECEHAQNKEIASFTEGKTCSVCHKGILTSVKAVEVGNIFKLGTKFSAPVDLLYRDADGKDHPVVMGSYGIGVERLMGTIVEVMYDARGIIWPETIAPADIHLLCLGEYAGALKKFADEVYTSFTHAGYEVLYDDRTQVSAGEKFHDADLLGIPWRVVVSEKTLTQNVCEVKKRSEEKSIIMSQKEFIHKYPPHISK